MPCVRLPGGRTRRNAARRGNAPAAVSGCLNDPRSDDVLSAGMIPPGDDCLRSPDPAAGGLAGCLVGSRDPGGVAVVRSEVSSTPCNAVSRTAGRRRGLTPSGAGDGSRTRRIRHDFRAQEHLPAEGEWRVDEFPVLVVSLRPWAAWPCRSQIGGRSRGSSCGVGGPGRGDRAQALKACQRNRTSRISASYSASPRIDSRNGSCFARYG